MTVLATTATKRPPAKRKPGTQPLSSVEGWWARQPAQLSFELRAGNTKPSKQPRTPDDAQHVFQHASQPGLRRASQHFLDA